jgi:hypothetical protein
MYLKHEMERKKETQIEKEPKPVDAQVTSLQARKRVGESMVIYGIFNKLSK